MNYDKPPDDPQSNFEFHEQPRKSLIDPGLSHAVTEDAIYRATFLSDDEYKDAMRQAVWETAKRHRYFIVDNVWAHMGAVGDGDRDNGSGMGAILRECGGKDGFIENTGMFQRSERPETHRTPRPLWHSKIFEGDVNGQIRRGQPEGSGDHPGEPGEVRGPSLGMGTAMDGAAPVARRGA